MGSLFGSEEENDCPFTSPAPAVEAAEKPPRKKASGAKRKVAKAVVEIESTGPIKEGSVPIEPGTVVVLRGANGAGKSTAIDAVKAAITCGKCEGVNLSPMDGHEAEGGHIEFNGVTIRVGAKRITKKGAPIESYVLVEGGEAMESFCDPPVKDPESADARRIKAMLSMVGVTLTRSSLCEFLGEDTCKSFLTEHRGVLEKPMVEVIGLLRRWLQSQAREMEDESKKIEGEIAAIGVVPDDEPCADPVELMKIVEQRRSEYDRLVGQKKAADDAARAIQGESDGVDVEEIRVALEGSVSRIRELQSQLDAEREKAAGLRERLASAEEQVRRIGRLREAMKSTVTDDHVSEAKSALDAAINQRDSAVVASQKQRENVNRRTRLAEARKLLSNSIEQSKRMRGLCDSSVGILNKEVEKFEGWSVSKDLRLMCHHEKRGMIPIAEHSPGERIQQAIRLMLPSFKIDPDDVPVCVIPQKLFEQLDIDGQDNLVRLAKENDLCVVVGQCRKSRSEPSELSVDVLA